jgi:Ser/Thr protein kinase RdoA (MazF antagonist)
MSNWTQTVTSAPVSAPAAAPSDDDALAVRLRSAIDGGQLPERDRDFARSLLRGYERYGRFTDRQRPYVERLIKAAAVPSPDAALAERLRAALSAGGVPWNDQDFARSLLRGYERYNSFTDRQRPYAERLAAPRPGRE